MGDSVDVRALRAKFNNKASTSDTSSRDSNSPKSPRPGFGRAILPVAESELAPRLSPTVPPSLPGPGFVRLPRVEPMAASIPPRPGSVPRPLAYAGLRASIQPADTTKVKQTGEMLQNMMLRHQRPQGPQVPQAPLVPPVPPVPRQGAGSPAPVPLPTSTPLPLRQQSRQRSAGDVTPLRRPLPPEGPMPVKPKRPPNVNLEPFRKNRRAPAPAPPAPRKSDSPANRRMSLPTVISPPKPPQRSDKPKRLQRQIASADMEEDEQDLYDDIDIDKNESCSDHSSQCVDGDEDDDVYEFIDEDQVDVNKKEAKKQQEKEKKQSQKKMNELRKKFQLQGEIEVIHTAKVRHDWNGGGKLDLSVHQGESVEILRVKNNPGGKWLARSLNGNYGYISNSCVDIDYEEVKRKVLQSRKTDTSALPPPPPDPPQILNMESNSRDSIVQDDDDYDDVQPMTEDFPPPPPEISIDPKVEKDLRKKFKYDGPIRVLHTMMVDPNCIIKKPGAKDLPVAQGDVVDVIQLTNSKKALCRNRFGKYGYVSRSFLLQMEQDIYDDVDYADDVYDNDSLQTDY